MDIVVVEHQIRQAVEIVERAEGLSQFLVQAVADFLRRHVFRDEDGETLAALDLGPAQIGAAGVAEFLPARHVGHDDAGGVGRAARQFGLGQGLDGDRGGLTGGHTGDLDPCLGAEAVHQARQVVAERGGDALAGDA